MPDHLEQIVPYVAAAVAIYYGNYWLAAAIILGQVVQATQKKPKRQDPFSSEGRLVTIRQPVAPWQIVVGEVRVGGTLTFAHVSPDRRFIYLVITLAGHEVDQITDIYFADEKLFIQSNGLVAGRYAKTTQTGHIELVTVPSSPPYRIHLAGLIGFHDVNRNADRFGLQNIYDYDGGLGAGVPTNSEQYAVDLPNGFLILHSSLAGQVLQIYYEANDITSSWVQITKSTGAESAQPCPSFVSETSGDWTDAHRQAGKGKLFVRLEANPDLFPTGVPQITAIVRGLKAYDPRTGLTTWTSNPALAVAHYFTNTAYGLAADYAEEIHEDDLIAAANACDELVDMADTGSEKRYRANGTFQTNEQPKDIINKLLSAMQGKAVNQGDKWRILAGVYTAPTVTLTQSDAVGPLQIQPMLSRHDNANGVKGICVMPEHNWQPDDFPPVASDTYLAEDGGERIWRDLDLSAMVTGQRQAQRIAKIDLLKTRQALTVSGLFKLTAFGIVPGKSVSLTFSKYGWNAKAFEVLTWQLAVTPEGEVGIALSLRETAPEIYDWSTSEEQSVDFAPNTNLPDPRDVPAPGNPDVQWENYLTRDGRGVATRVIVTWDPGNYNFGGGFQLEYRPTTDDDSATWTVLPSLSASSSTPRLVIEDLARGRYDFRVKRISPLGVSSAYAETLNFDVVGLGDVPADITGLSLQAVGGMAVLTWDLHPAVDVQKGGRIYIRHSASLTGATWNGSYSIGEVDSWPGASVIAGVPLKEGTYLVLAEDSTGIQSDMPATITTKQAHVLAFTSLSTITEDTTYVGTHSNTVAIDSLLKLAGTGLFDAIPDLDAAGGIDDDSEIFLSGTYTFAAGYDAGSVKNLRLTSDLAVQIDNVRERFDDRTIEIDDWTDFDGAGNGAVCDCYVELRETDTDPAVSPTWSTWKRLDASEHIARAFQFRAQLVSTDSAYNILVTRLRVKIEQAV